MPKSAPWNAPEYHHRGFRPHEAMKMDVYSFGMLCLWLLFKDRPSVSPPLPRKPSQEKEDFVLFDETGNQYRLLEKWKMEGRLSALANWLLMTETRLNDEKKNALGQFFNLTLTHKPDERSTDFNRLLSLIAPSR